MPLNITVAINDRPIAGITIARLQKFRGPSEWHEYIITSGTDEALYMHRYDEGAEECLRRGLEALAKMRSGR